VKRILIPILMVITWAATATGGSRYPIASTSLIHLPLMAATTVSTPLTFISTPGGTQATQSVTFFDDSGTNNSPWQLRVSTASANFSGSQCPTKPIPASSLAISCVNVTQGGEISCPTTPQPLSTTPYTIATGSYHGNKNIQVIMSIAFSDNWNYAATAGTGCTLQIQYAVSYN
jgi:hypothetical protein